MQVLGGVVTAVGYHTFWEVAAEGGVGSRVLVTDELLDSKPLPFCFTKKLIQHISLCSGRCSRPVNGLVWNGPVSNGYYVLEMADT